MIERTAAELIRAEIIKSGPGSVFTPSHFRELVAEKGTVERTLSRLAQKGSVQRIGHGLYYYPESGTVFGVLPPKPEAVAQALAEGSPLVPSGPTALHRLGLTTQVPMKYSYLTGRSSRTEQLGKIRVELNKVPERRLSGAGTKAGEILSAIEYVGHKEASSAEFCGKIARKLTEQELAQLQQAAKPRFEWVKSVVEKITKTWRLMNECAANA